MARIVVILPFTLVLFICSAIPAQTTPPPTGSTPTRRPPEPTYAERASDESPVSISDFQLVTWIIIECDGQNHVSRLAVKQATSENVRQYAQQMIKYRDQLSGQLVRVIRVEDVDGRNTTGEDPSRNLSALLDELSVRLEAREEAVPRGATDAAVEAPLSTLPPVRNNPPIAHEQAHQPAEARIEQRLETTTDPEASQTTDERIEANRETRRDQLQDRLDRLGLRRDAGPQADRRDGRVRELMRDALPVIRQNMPEILDLLGEAVENSTDDNSSLALMQFQREISQSLSTRIIDELTRNPGDMDPGYLGYELVAHDRLISTIQVAKKYASPQLRSVLEQQSVTLNGQLQEARRLMRER